MKKICVNQNSDTAILDSWASDMMTLPGQFLRRFMFSDLSIIGTCSQFMLPQNETTEFSRKVRKFLSEVQHSKSSYNIWNSRFGNQGAMLI